MIYPATDQVLKRIQTLYESYGEIDYIGEPVSLLQHSLQAGYFARREGHSNDEEFILACLFHDIGHVLGLEANLDMKMGNCGIMDHENLGGDFLRVLGFTTRVSDLVRNHVQAKRYLCGTNPQYYSELSEASKTTLGYQGGPMTAEECEKFPHNPLFSSIIALRKMDELAKVENNFGLENLPLLKDYFPLIERNLQLRKEQDNNNGSVNQQPSLPRDISLAKNGYILSDVQIQQFRENSYLKLTNFLPHNAMSVADIRAWVDEMLTWPAKVEDKWLMHYELSTMTPAVGSDSQDKILCRIENFVNYHPAMKSFTTELIQNIVSQLFHQAAVLLKEKINFKLSGGAGFACHQDTPAYLGFGHAHISVMVAIDDATQENGCLQVAPGQWVKDQVHLTKDGVVVPEEESQMSFVPLTCKAGDIVFFTGFIPHRSEANHSAHSRRAMFLTYNPSADGDFHVQYYQAKHAKKHGFDAGAAISFQNDFQGKIVD
jgi:predicted HD phosphohydrolase/ectoine hydroxylase-related dioxygenase (phytanoyl-CoA dioxygenase family)